ncbi:MAG: indolepyruvate ferredoxin oxidoreductase family protein [Gordonia amarae]
MTTQPSDVAAPAPANPLEQRFDLADGDVHLSGIQALVRLPMDQHRLDERRGLRTSTFISGYEGSPLAGLDLALNKQRTRLEEHNVVFKPSVNEELAATAVQGSQIASNSPDRIGDGVVGIWYGKAPGLDRASDALRHSNLSGTHPAGGVLALVGDDAIAKSSTVPSSSEPAIAELGMPCLSPADPQEILDLGLHGIAMSRVCGLWVAMKLATNVVDGSGSVHLDSGRVSPVEPDRGFGGKVFTHEMSGKLLQPVLSGLEATQSRERIELARRYAAANGLNRVIGDHTARVGIVCAGLSYREVRGALADIGITDATIDDSGVRILKLGLVHPLEPSIVGEFARSLDEIIVVEDKRAFIELAIKDLLYGTPGAPAIVGRRDTDGRELFRAHDDLPADYLAPRLAPRLRDHGAAPCVAEWIDRQATTKHVPTLLPILPRTPYFCSGCPHNSSTKVPDGALIGAGIGCHGLVTIMPSERVGDSIGLCAMGGEGAAWIGMSSFVTHNHLFQNLGDGTFHHSGSLAIRASVAAGTNVTYKLLYNDTVAMTGGQDAVGKMRIPQVVSAMLAEGVKQVVITSPDPKASRRAFGRFGLPARVVIRHRDDLLTVQEELAQVPGVTLLIHEQECATELRRKRKRGLVTAPVQRITINERVCEGCGDCGDISNCLSVQPVDTEFGRKTRIHQDSCNLDFSCAKGDCPSFVEVIPGGKAKKRVKAPQVDPASLPDPRAIVDRSDFRMRITGVGGTGVVTVAQVLAAAATHAGLSVTGLDQLGLAQKGGAVVSDIRFSDSDMVGSNKIGIGGCDLYLGCDVLVAAAPANLTTIGADRTYAIVSTSVTPTGAMVTDTHTTFPDIGTLRDRIEWAGSRPENVFVDARAELGDALGSDQLANIFLLGVAVQAGVLPLSPADIEWALDLNGVQVDRNQTAFRMGRRHAAGLGADAPENDARPRYRGGEIAGIVAAEPDLAAIVALRVDELIGYQGPVHAHRYADAIERFRAAESARLGTDDITSEYARQLFKVMAYKDEYEVARLYLDPAFTQQLVDAYGEVPEYSVMLHPPALRAMGAKKKIKLKSWSATPAFKGLYAMRRLRGTKFDLFGYSEVRRRERQLITDYLEAMTVAAGALTPQNRDLVAELAGLPEWVRGYEHIKLTSIDTFDTRRADLLTRLRTGATGPVAH